RAQSIAEQLRMPEPQPVTFVDNEVSVKSWSKLGASNSTALEELRVEQTRRVLRVQAQGRTTAGWVTRLWLPTGTYEFMARAEVREVVTGAGARNAGAGLRSPMSRWPSRRLTGNSEWEELRCRLVVRSTEDMVELVCDLRNASGEVWFDLDSLKLKRLRDA